jgi:hypothetical protein
LRQKLKLILFAALCAALTVTGLSIAAGGGGSGSDRSDSADGPRMERGFVKRGDGPPGGIQFDRDVADVMRQIHEAVERKAPEIAGPVIQKAEDAGDITAEQADKLRAAAQALADGKRPELDRSLMRDADVRKVVKDAFEAAHKEAAELGEPIIQKALDEKKITSDQANDIRDRLKNPPPFGPGPGHGPPGFGGGPGHGPPGFGRIDRDVAEVLRDVHVAAEKQEPKSAKQLLAIAEPIIDKAVDEKKITKAQGDDLRDKLKHPPRFRGGKLHRFRGAPPPGFHRGPPPPFRDGSPDQGRGGQQMVLPGNPA